MDCEGIGIPLNLARIAGIGEASASPNVGGGA